jgi:hypothetical protein
MPPEFVETSTRGEQFVDRPVLNESAIVEEEDTVGMTNARQPVGDNERGGAAKPIRTAGLRLPPAIAAERIRRLRWETR